MSLIRSLSSNVALKLPALPACLPGLDACRQRYFLQTQSLHFGYLARMEVVPSYAKCNLDAVTNL